MSVRLTFACGHGQTWNENDVPICATCGERRVSRTKAPAPRFRGVCVGPSATPEALGAVPVSVGTKETQHG